MKLKKAFGYMNRFPWLEMFFREHIGPPAGSQNDAGWLAALLHNRTQDITVQPLQDLDFTSNPTCHYTFRIPKAEIGVKKSVDMLAFCITSPSTFRLSEKSGEQMVMPDSIAIDHLMTYSVTITFCYRFSAHPRYNVHRFAYLPSTHSIAETITALCAKHGHTTPIGDLGKPFMANVLEPTAFVVEKQICSSTLGSIFRTFEIYDANRHSNPVGVDITDFCLVKHR